MNQILYTPQLIISFASIHYFTACPTFTGLQSELCTLRKASGQEITDVLRKKKSIAIVSECKTLLQRIQNCPQQRIIAKYRKSPKDLRINNENYKDRFVTFSSKLWEMV